MRNTSVLRSLFTFFFLICCGTMVFGLSTTVIGKIESVYLQRASLRVLEIPENTGSDTCPLSIGQKISFNLPVGNKKGRGAFKADFGKVYEVVLDGSQITEYAPDEQKHEADEMVGNKKDVFVWNASQIKKVKDQRKYLEDKDDGDKNGRKKGRRRKKKKEKEPPKIWTQVETIRGQVVYDRKNLLYIKESGVGKKSFGLHVADERWVENLKSIDGKNVVVSGTTHRTSPSSGTMDIDNIIKIYPK